MPLVLKDRVRETTNTTGTGTYTLAGAVTGFQSFSVIGNGNTTYYTVTDGTNWEVGIGTYTSSGTTLSRDTILESSNAGSAVSWGAGSKDVFVTYPAERSMYVDGTTITPAIAARLPYSSLAQGSALSVLGVTANATGDNASIAAGTDHQVLRRSGTSLAFGAVNLASTNAVTGTLPLGNGGTGQTTAQAAMNTFAGAVTSGSYLRGNGTNVVMSTIQAGDVPTLNQNTTGSAATLTTARTIQTNLASTSAASFNGSANITPGVTGVLPIGSGGTGSSLTDPNADRILFWDDSVGAVDWLTIGTGLSISGTTISATSGSGTVTSVSGTGSVNGITLSGTVTTSGSLTLGGTLSGVSLTSQVSGTLPIANGGTGQTGTPSNGQLLIGNGTGFTRSTLTAGTGISISNSSGGITVSSTVTGTVTNVSGTGTVNGITLSGSVSTSGNLFLTGSISGVQLGSAVTGTLPIGNGGTGQTSTPSNGQLLIGNSAAAGYSLATLTAGSGISISNGFGSITISASGGASGVSSFSAGSTGLTPSSATTGAITLGGTLAVANGGTGVTTSTGTGNTVRSAGPIFTGNVGFGTQSSPAYAIDAGTNTSGQVVGRFINYGGTNYLLMQTYATGGNYGNVLLFYDSSGNTTGLYSGTPAGQMIVIGGTSGGVILQNGSTAWASMSDERLKNITGTLENGLDKILSLRPVHFTWKKDKKNKSCVGLIAQEVQKVLPEVVDDEPDPNNPEYSSVLTVRYTEVVPLLVAAIKDLNAKVEALKAEVSLLRG